MAKISVLIPVYNCERFIETAITSGLNQADEVIVYDDCSTDETVEIVKNYNVKLYCGQQKIGAQKARNLLISLSSGDWLQFLDADDYLFPGKIASQIKLECMVSYTNFAVEKFINYKYNQTYLVETNRLPLIESLLRYETMPATGCFLFHRKVFNYIQWDETQRYFNGMHDRKITLDLLNADIIPYHVEHDGYLHRCGWSPMQISQGQHYMEPRKQFTQDLYEWAKNNPSIAKTYDLAALERQTWKRIKTEESLSRC